MAATIGTYKDAGLTTKVTSATLIGGSSATSPDSITFYVAVAATTATASQYSIQYTLGNSFTTYFSITAATQEIAGAVARRKITITAKTSSTLPATASSDIKFYTDKDSLSTTFDCSFVKRIGISLSAPGVLSKTTGCTREFEVAMQISPAASSHKIDSASIAFSGYDSGIVSGLSDLVYGTSSTESPTFYKSSSGNSTQITVKATARISASGVSYSSTTSKTISCSALIFVGNTGDNATPPMLDKYKTSEFTASAQSRNDAKYYDVTGLSVPGAVSFTSDTATNVGSSYNAKVFVGSGYSLIINSKDQNDSTSATYKWAITPKTITAPSIEKGTDSQSFQGIGIDVGPTINNVDTNWMTLATGSVIKADTVNNNYSFTYALKYNTNGNTVWDDDTTNDKTYTWKIIPHAVTKPNQKYNFDYTGSTIKLIDKIGGDFSTWATIGGETPAAANVGTYNASAILSDKSNCVWSGGTSTSDIAISWTINGIQLDTPTATKNTSWDNGRIWDDTDEDVTSSISYDSTNGKLQYKIGSGAWSDWGSASVLSGKDNGSYTIYWKCVPKSSSSAYVESNSTSLTYTISKRSVYKPNTSYQTTYTGSEIKLVDIINNNDFSTYGKLGGNTSGKAVKSDYKATADLKDSNNCIWEGGGTDTVNITWEIYSTTENVPTISGCVTSYTGNDIQLVTSASATAGNADKVMVSLDKTNFVKWDTLKRSTPTVYDIYYKALADGDYTESSVRGPVRAYIYKWPNHFTKDATGNSKTYPSSENMCSKAEATSGTVQYSVDNKYSWSTSIPTFSDKSAGTYTIYYKAEGVFPYEDTSTQSTIATLNSATQVWERDIEIETTIIYDEQPHTVIKQTPVAKYENASIEYAITTTNIIPDISSSEWKDSANDIKVTDENTYYVWYRALPTTNYSGLNCENSKSVVVAKTPQHWELDPKDLLNMSKDETRVLKFIAESDTQPIELPANRTVSCTADDESLIQITKVAATETEYEYYIIKALKETGNTTIHVKCSDIDGIYNEKELTRALSISRMPQHWKLSPEVLENCEANKNFTLTIVADDTGLILPTNRKITVNEISIATLSVDSSDDKIIHVTTKPLYGQSDIIKVTCTDLSGSYEEEKIVECPISIIDKYSDNKIFIDGAWKDAYPHVYTETGWRPAQLYVWTETGWKQLNN